jgi:hypothetical protein
LLSLRRRETGKAERAGQMEALAAELRRKGPS